MDFAATALLHLSADDRPKASNSNFDLALNELNRVVAAELDTLDVDHYNSLYDVFMVLKRVTQMKNLTKSIADITEANGMWFRSLLAPAPLNLSFVVWLNQFL